MPHLAKVLLKVIQAMMEVIKNLRLEGKKLHRINQQVARTVLVPPRSKKEVVVVAIRPNLSSMEQPVLLQFILTTL